MVTETGRDTAQAGRVSLRQGSTGPISHTRKSSPAWTVNVVRVPVWLVLALAASPAQAQDWRTTGTVLPEWYSEQCCGARDCRPISSRETISGLLRWIPRNGGGWLVTDSGEFLAEQDANGNRNWRIQPSRDFRNHICRIPRDPLDGREPGRTVCLYIAPPGN